MIACTRPRRERKGLNAVVAECPVSMWPLQFLCHPCPTLLSVKPPVGGFVVLGHGEPRAANLEPRGRTIGGWIE